MLLTERHFVNTKHSNYKEIDSLAFKSKNLYNFALYTQNQEYEKNKRYIPFNELDKLLQNHESYKALPSKVSQQVLLKLHKNWESFFALVKIDKTARPPKYKNKLKGRNCLTYTKQAIKKRNILSKTNIQVNTKRDIQEIRISPKRFGYFIEVIYEQKEEKLVRNNKNIASIDLGINNLVTITSNHAKALLVNGRILKSINQYYNKFPTKKNLRKRYFRIKNYFHHTSRFIVDYCLNNKISKLIIGYNEGWKQNINLGKKTNQNFVYIPFLDLINQIKYKCNLIGIEVIITEESYTSKASYFDFDPIPSYNEGNELTFSGKRVKRGLYQYKDGSRINADINGSLNIGRKVIHDYVVDRSLVARPVKVNPLRTQFNIL